MSGWTDWETVRRQVAVCGRVVDAHGRPMGDVLVSIEPVAPAEPGGSTRSGADGVFWFMDLPAGKYRIGAGSPEVSSKRTLSVAWDATGNIEKAVVDLRLAGA